MHRNCTWICILVFILVWALWHSQPVQASSTIASVASPSPIFDTPRFYTRTITLPTYPYVDYLSEVFTPTYQMTYTVLNWDAYLASQPNPMSKTYTLLVMENDYVTVTVMPELGGRVYQFFDKTTGHNHLYQNPVVKPTPWGPPEQGWWLAVGGIEWCLPVEEHGYEWGIPWHWAVLTSTAGVTVTVWDTQATDRLRATLDLFLPADGTYLAVTPQLDNPTSQAINYKFWSNAALAPGPQNHPTENLHFFFNAEQMQVHSTSDARLPGAGQVFNWPVHNAVDYSRLGNWTGWLGFFEYPQAARNFVGVYNEDADIGMLRVFPPDIARGAKGFAYGWSAALPSSLWTDDDSGGVEIHGGVAPTFWHTASLQAGSILTWTEFWYPLRAANGISTANANGVLHLAGDPEQVNVGLQTTASHVASQTQLYLWDAATCITVGHQQLPALDPLSLYTVTWPIYGRSLDQLSAAWVHTDTGVLAAINGAACLDFVPPLPHLGYGLNVRRVENLPTLAAPLDFEWIKLWEEYIGDVPSAPLPYKVLYLINCGGQYIQDLDAWGNHVEAIAQDGRGVVQAYEICNETNTHTFWAQSPPDPQVWTAMLCTAYERIKAVDPNAVVVSGGLAPVGRIEGNCNGWPDNDCGAMDERTYVQAMLDHGAGACVDAVGYHPYGFAYAPERDAYTVSNGFAFRGAEVMHDILSANGYPSMPVWATEFNWIRRPTDDGFYCDDDPGYYNNFKWQEVSAQMQANYLMRAYQYADAQWPWMGGMFVWNLDWHNYQPYFPCLHSRYYALRRYDRTDTGATTLAYSALATLAKRPGLTLTPRLSVKPVTATLLINLDAPRTVTATYAIDNVGYGTFTWTARVVPGGSITPALPVTQGAPGQKLWAVVDPAAARVAPYPGSTMLWSGTFSSALRITTWPTTVVDAPKTVQLVVQARPELATLYLPVVSRAYP